MKITKKKTRNDKEWFILYDHVVKGYYVCMGGFRHNWYKTEYEAKQIRDKFNKEGI